MCPMSFLKKTVYWYRIQKGIFSKGEMNRNKKYLSKIRKEAEKSSDWPANNLSWRETTKHSASGWMRGSKALGCRSLASLPHPRREGDIRKPPGVSPLTRWELSGLGWVGEIDWSPEKDEIWPSRRARGGLLWTKQMLPKVHQHWHSALIWRSWGGKEKWIQRGKCHGELREETNA